MNTDIVTSTNPSATEPDQEVEQAPSVTTATDRRAVRRPRVSRLRKLCLIALATLSLATSASLVGSTPASAAQLLTSGSVGYVNAGTGICRYYDAWRRLDVELYAPDIYAPNHRAGGGNDWAMARYKVHVRNQYGTIVQSSGYSGWAWAYDNSPAIFSKVPTKFTNIPNYSTVAIQVEWMNGTTNGGVAFHSPDRYVLYSAGTGPYTWPNSCSTWTPF